MNKKQYFTVALIYTSVLFWLSLRPIPQEVSNLFPYQDKLMHLMAYFILATLYQRSLNKRGAALSLSIFIGVLIEILQSFTTYRSFELLDIVANSTGVFLSYFVIFTKYRINRSYH